MSEQKAPIIDRTFAEKFLRAAHRPMDYGVYFLLHDWWAEAPQRALDQYAANLRDMEGADAFFAVTAAHVAFVAPEHIEATMDAMMRGWFMGRETPNLHLVKWEEQLDRPLAEIRADHGLDTFLARAA